MLYGRGKVLRFVTDGLDRRRNRDTPPVMLLIGPRGSGKTALLDRLETGNRTGSPTARLDFGLRPDATPTAVMMDIAPALSRHVANVGKPKFPLLGIGLVAVNLDAESRDTPAEQLQQRLGQRRLSGQTLANLTAQAGTLLPTQQRALVTEAATVLGWIVDSYNRHQLHEYLAWYARMVGPGDGSPHGPLLLLHKKWHEAVTHANADVRREAERDVWRALCAALLQDLRAGFDKAGVWHGIRTTNCLLLIDNAGTKAGTEFLETVAECRRQASDQTDPLLVVAGWRTRPVLQPSAGTPVAAGDDRLSHASWLAAVRGQEEQQPSPWYPVLLTGLSDGDVKSLVGSHVLGRTWYDADYVHALSGGNPAAVRELSRRLGRAGEEFDPRDLLSPGMEDQLLAALRPDRLDDQQLRAMAIFGATLRPRPKAAGSVFRSMGEDLARVNELAIHDMFLDLMWAEDEASWLNIHPLPRLLLSRWLARDRSGWEAVHEGFLAYYRTQGVRERVAEQYHRLALTTSMASDNLRRVAAGLDEQLENRDMVAWNAALTVITTAPNRLKHADDDRVAAGDEPDFSGDVEDVVKRLAGVAVPDVRQRTVTRLVAARWLYNDRLFDPAHRLARLLAEEYYDLARLTDGDSEEFYREASRFRQVAREWEDSL